MYSESDIPVHLKDGEMLTLADGTTVRFEGNAEAKDIFINEGFTADVQLFPGCDWFLEAGGNKYRLEARMENDLLVEKV